MGLKEIFSSLKSSSSTSNSLNSSNGNSKRNTNNGNSISNKKNRYNLHNYSLDNDLLTTEAPNCILINKTNLNTLTSPTPTSTSAAVATTLVNPKVNLTPTLNHQQKSTTLTRRDSARSNNNTSLNNSTSESTRLLIENHAKHVNSILNLNSQTIDYLNELQITKNRHNSNTTDTINKQTCKSMVTSPSCDVALLANKSSSIFDSLTKTPDFNSQQQQQQQQLSSNSGSTRSINSRTRIKTNPWIRSPSFHNTTTTITTTATPPNGTNSNSSTTSKTTNDSISTPNRLNHVRSHTNDDIMSLSESNGHKRFNKLNLSFTRADEITNSICKKCFSLKCLCLQKSKDSGISSIISNNNSNSNTVNSSNIEQRQQEQQFSPVLQLSPLTTFESILTPKFKPVTTITTTSSSSTSSSSSLSSINKNSILLKTDYLKLSPQQVTETTTKTVAHNTDILEKLRNNDDYSILFEEALESSSNDSYSLSGTGKLKTNKTPLSTISNNNFKRNSTFRYSLDPNLIKRKSSFNNSSNTNKSDLTANFVAEVTSLFDKAISELPDFTDKTKLNKTQSPQPTEIKSIMKSINNDDNHDDDDLELENSVNELYKQIEILKIQKKMLDEKMSIAKQESYSNV